MEFLKLKEEDLQVTDMIQVFLQDQGHGEKRIQKNILGMTGKSHMGVNQELGTMLYQKTLQKNLSFYWLNRLQTWLTKLISKRKLWQKIWWLLKRKLLMLIKNVRQLLMKSDDWNQNSQTKHLKMKFDIIMSIISFLTIGRLENTWLSMEIWSENPTKRFSLI